MTIEEIFSEIGNHMIVGLMIHEQLSNYYDFLGLCGYKRCHEYHYIEESKAYKKLCSYYINHYNKLMKEEKVDVPTIIPESWYRYTRQDVDTNTKQNAVRSGLTKWVDWEQQTKALYQRMYKEAINIDEIASACEIKKLICDVDCELKKAEKYLLNKEAVGYNISDIIGEQHYYHKKYKDKLKRVTVC